MVIAPGGNVGIGSSSPRAGLEISTTGDNSALIVPRDTVANRPTTAVNGMIRYASDANQLEGYIGGAWRSLAALGGNQSFAGDVNVGGAFTTTGAATFNTGATITGGALAMSSQNITNVGSSISGADALSINAGGTNQNLSLGGSGTGSVILKANVGIGDTAPGTPLSLKKDLGVGAGESNLASFTRGTGTMPA